MVERSTAFDSVVKEAKANKTFKGVRDAKKKLKFEISERDVRAASRGDESQCVIAKAVERALINDCVMSIGETVSKVFDLETGIVTRYQTPVTLKKALGHFDRTGQWELKPGVYYLAPPSGNTRLVKNQGEEGRERLKQR